MGTYTKKYIEIVIESRLVENFRVQKRYSPTILKMISKSKYRWWDNEEETKDEIKNLIDSINRRRINKFI